MDDEYFGFSSEPDLPEHVPENGEQQRKKADIDLEEVNNNRGREVPPGQEDEGAQIDVEALINNSEEYSFGDEWEYDEVAGTTPVEGLLPTEETGISKELSLTDTETDVQKRTKGIAEDLDEMERNPTLSADDDQLSDILLVMDQEEQTVKAVKGVGKDGKLQTVPVDEENKNSFLKLDRHGSILTNFFKNFMSQAKNPTQFKFLKVPVKVALKVLRGIVKFSDIPPEELEKIIKQYEVKAKQKVNQGQSVQQGNGTQAVNVPNQQNQQTAFNGQQGAQPEQQGAQPGQQAQSDRQQVATDGKQQTVQPLNNYSNMEQRTSDGQSENQYRYNPEKIDWDAFKNFGITKEKLEKAGVLDTMLKGYKTPFLMPIALNAGAVILRQDARLAFREKQDGSICLAIHGIRKQPDFKMPFLGHEFTDEDKKALKQNGNMGRIIELEKPGAKGEKIKVPSIVSIDKLTNDLIALPADRIKIPEKIGGITLSEEQKQQLSEGKPLKLNGLTSKEGKPFDATLQFNAEKRYVEYVNINKNKYQQGQNQGEMKMEIPDNFRQVPISEEKQKTLKELGTIYMEGFKNKEDKPYQGYVFFNPDKGRLDFKFPHEYHEAVKRGEIEPIKQGDGPTKNTSQTNTDSNKRQVTGEGDNSNKNTRKNNAGTAGSEGDAGANKNSQKNKDEEKAKTQTQKVAPKRKGKKI